MPSDRQLAVVLTEFAHTMVTDFAIQSILDNLVERIVEVLPISAAGVTLVSPAPGQRDVAFSGESAHRFQEIEVEVGEGPTMSTDQPVAIPDLLTDGRFPAFARRAGADGLAAVFTIPLCHGDETLGVLALYRTSVGPLDADAVEVAQTLADVAAAYLLNARARAELHDSAERFREIALHDSLTGLPNRALMLERLDHALLRSQRSGGLTAVLFIDLDRFKQVNDDHGHDVGDSLLMLVAERLAAVLRPGDTLARMSSDEFVVLCEDVEGSGITEEIAGRVGAALALPYRLGGLVVELTASVGIAFSGRNTSGAGQLLKDADAAMYQAKRSGGARHQVIDLREQHLEGERAGMERDLRGAQRRGELRTLYQPIVSAADGRLTGVEALLRWAHPTRGVVSPDLMVPIAERAGLITEIGQWVLEQACPDLLRWESGRRGGPGRGLSVAVNVSAHQLASHDYPATVAEVLALSGVDPGSVTLEVTESVFVRDSKRALVVLGELKSLGVRLALDDFGTGYSSLNYLKQFPIDIVKVDKGFVSDLGHNGASDAIVSSVIELAHMLGMTVVAEGVETAEQHERLAALGCDSCQGFYFGRPVSAEHIATIAGQRSPPGGAHLPAVLSRWAP